MVIRIILRILFFITNKNNIFLLKKIQAWEYLVRLVLVTRQKVFLLNERYGNR